MKRQLRRGDDDIYLSQVILCIEETRVPWKVNHSFGVVLCLVDDGQVEQPVETEKKGVKTC